jgi:hypothetical protein
MLQNIIETIDMKNSWGKTQLLAHIEPEISNITYKALSGMDTVKHSIINMALLDFEEYIKSKASHGKVELKLALLDCIAKQQSEQI